MTNPVGSTPIKIVEFKTKHGTIIVVEPPLEVVVTHRKTNRGKYARLEVNKDSGVRIK